MNSAARRRRPAAFRFGRLVMWLVSGVLLIAIASYVALPVGLAWYMPQLAARHGIPLEVERVRVDPFRSTVILHEVGVATSGESSLGWSNVVARVDLAELVAGRLALDDFRLSNTTLHVSNPNVGLEDFLRGMPATLPGGVSVGELVIDGMELGALPGATGLRIAIDRLRVASLDEAFRPEGAEVEANLSVGDGHARLLGRINLGGGGWILGAEVSAKGVPLEEIRTLLGAGGSWRGQLRGTGPVRVMYSPRNGAFSATTRGRWTIDAPGIGLAPAEISGARADWHGIAFLAVSGDGVNGLGATGEISVREPRIEVADMFDVEATELALRVDASRTPDTRVALNGRIPVLRLDGKGGGFAAVGAQAGNVVSRIALTFTDSVTTEVEELRVDTLDVKLPGDRSVDLEKIELARMDIEWDANVVSAATGTAQRIDWRGFAGALHAGTAARLAVEGVERAHDGELRFDLASAETVSDRNGESEWRLHDVALESAAVSPSGSISVGGARIIEARVAGGTRTLVLEGLDLDGVAWNESGGLSVESGRTRVVDHMRAGVWGLTGTGLELAGAAMSDDAWTARSVRLGAVDVGTADASWALRGLTLTDAAGEGDDASARLAGVDGLELDFGGHRVVVEELSAELPAWHEDAVGARSIGAAATALDTVQRHRWRSGAWRLTRIEREASGRASAETASLENLVLTVPGGSTTGTRALEIDDPTFDGESTVTAAGAVAQRAYHRTSDGAGLDVSGLSADGVEWNGEALSVGRAAALLMSAAAPSVRASFDGVSFTSVRVGVDGAHEFASLGSESGRGGVGRGLEWSAEGLTLDGYRATASGRTTLGFIETRHLDLGEASSEARLRADRAAARDVRVDPAGEAMFAVAEVEGVTVRDTRFAASTAARALRASALTIRDSALEIGTLSLSGVETAVAVSEAGAWELPALPVGAGNLRPSFAVRIREAGIADSGSVVHITDRTTQPDFAQSVEIGHASLRGFDSASVGVPSRFSVEATADIFTALRADGALVPTLTGNDLDLAASVRGLSLRALSPYARLHLGRSVERGHADVAFVATVRTSDLAGDADFALGDVVLGRAEPSDPAMDALAAALETLADEQDRIELKVHLRGRLDAPDFDFDGLVARALAGAATGAVGAPPRDK